MRAILLSMVMLLAGLALPAAAQGTDEAQPQLVVVELFTSQGCSSCPPADALIAELAKRDDVLPLALHVDYWDYIGWADTFARPENTARQKAYARAVGARSIYTPQMVIAGREHVLGFKPMDVAEYVLEHRARIGQIGLEGRLEGDRLVIRAWARPGAEVAAGTLVDLVSFIPEARVRITRGENAGMTMTYANVVTGWHHLGRWDGEGFWSAELPLPADMRDPKLGLAVLLQAPGPGEIYCAIRLR